MWQQAAPSGQVSEIVLAHSPAGLTWGAPKTVSEPTAASAFMPAVEVARSGEVAVTYYDLTYDTVDSKALETDVWVVRARAARFGERERLTASSFDMRAAPVVAGGFFVGDYEGLASTDGRDFLAFFVAADEGDAENPTDGYVARVNGRIPRP